MATSIPASPYRNSILLNPSPNHYTIPLPPFYSSSSTVMPPSLSSSATSSSSSSSSLLSPQQGSDTQSPQVIPKRNDLQLPHEHYPQHRSASVPSSRRIRFAPLPDPRRAVAVTDDGNELPLDNSADYLSLTLSPATSSTSLRPLAGAGMGGGGASVNGGSLPPSPFLSPRDECDSEESFQFVSHALPSAMTLPGRSPYANPPSSTTSSSTFTPGYGKGDSTPTLNPNSSSANMSAGSRLDLKSKLFKPFLKRSSSPCPPLSSFHMSADDLRSLSLTRWSSASSAASAASSTKKGTPKKDWFGAPISRTTSTQSERGRPSAGVGVSSNMAKTPSGTRMLNGRVYGAKRNQAHRQNLFATARDVEPEFVEWGYGGMGSVRSGEGHAGLGWGRVQGSSGLKVGAVDGTAGGDDDDGSGLGWVKRRKERREREEKERRERETKEREGVGGSDKENEIFAEKKDDPVGQEKEAFIVNEKSVEAEKGGEQEQEEQTFERKAERIGVRKDGHASDEHITAITIPATIHIHHRSSNDGRPSDTVGEDEDEGEESSGESSPFVEDLDATGDGEDDEEDEEGEGEGEYEEDEEQTRKTALGAGVEKISRHKEDR